ncbi:hypothetical protein B0H16DRAFT_1888428 [Mycena metata]|uniref:DUF6534 domain-containing protein n=1 Tax=Mycena metata TaxID=1033252 RepID=A0AAD7N736_9AGAR|nr:hypothetical protein B0H16DRAFT_1888428 [Mycena metata]
MRVGGTMGLFAVSLAAFTIQKYVTRVMWLIEAVIVVGAVLDVLLAVSLCYYLRSWRHGGFRRMSKMVNQIMTWTIQTGIVTTTGALALLVTFMTMKDNLIYLAFFFLMAKLFSNSLLFSFVANFLLVASLMCSTPARLNSRERFARIFAEGFSNPGSAPVPRSLQFNSISLTDPTTEPSKPEHAHDRYAPMRIPTDADVSMRPPSSTSSPLSMREAASSWP